MAQLAHINMASSSSPSPNCNASSLPKGKPFSSSNDCLWDEIDLAERYLVSSQFDEAAALCLAVLQKLRRLNLSSDPLCQVLQRADDDVQSMELDDMIESAGMVFVQAYSETGRSSRIFDNLEPVFGCVAEVPPSIFLASVCLQMSAGFFSDARMAIESFLQNWTPTSSNGKAFMLKITGKQTCEPVYLKWEIYLDIVEIYCIEVLAKGLKSPDLALHFVREADFPEGNKQKLIEKLERICFLPGAKVGTDSSSKCKVNEGNLIPAPFGSWATALDAEAGERIDGYIVKKRVCNEDESVLSRSVQIFSPVVLFLSRLVSASSAYYSLYSPRWCKVLSKKRMVLNGAATFFLIYAIYRQRLHIRRLFKKFGIVLHALVHAIHMGFIDFWQLAFSAQLNPLAAVQPLPSSQYVRR